MENLLRCFINKRTIWGALALTAITLPVLITMEAYTPAFCLTLLVILGTLIYLLVKWWQLTWIHRCCLMFFVIALGGLEWYIFTMAFIAAIMAMP